MVQLNYFFQGFVGNMQTKNFETREAAEQFLEDNKNEVHVSTASIKEIDETSVPKDELLKTTASSWTKGENREQLYYFIKMEDDSTIQMIRNKDENHWQALNCIEDTYFELPLAKTDDVNELVESVETWIAENK